MPNGKMGKMFKQLQKAQQEMQKAQEEIKQKTVEASSGGGAVRAVMTGGKELIGLEIDPQVLEDGDLEMVQDLIMSAVNQAGREADKMFSEEMERIAGDLGLPKGLM